jgi:hypothetical protein
MHMLVDGFEGSLGIDQRDCSANRFVFDEEFVRISLCEDVVDSLSLLFDSSFDRVLSAVAYLADSRPGNVTVSAVGAALTALNFSLWRNMTIRVALLMRGGRLPPATFEFPGEVLLDLAYSERLFELLRHTDETVGQAALSLLNRVPQLLSRADFFSDRTGARSFGNAISLCCCMISIRSGI